MESTRVNDNENRESQKADYAVTFWVLGHDEGMCVLAAASCCCCCGEIGFTYDWDEHKDQLRSWMTEDEFNLAMSEIDETYRGTFGKHPAVNWGWILFPCFGCSLVAEHRENKAADQVSEVCGKLNRDVFHAKRVRWSVGMHEQTNFTIYHDDGRRGRQYGRHHRCHQMSKTEIGEKWRYITLECGIDYELQ